MGLRTRPALSTARSPTPSDWKVQRWRYARHAASRGIATQTRSAASWYAIACRSASAHRCIFISTAITVVSHDPTRSARRPRIGTSRRTSNPASWSHVATGSQRSDSKRNATPLDAASMENPNLGSRETGPLHAGLTRSGVPLELTVPALQRPVERERRGDRNDPEPSNWTSPGRSARFGFRTLKSKTFMEVDSRSPFPLTDVHVAERAGPPLWNREGPPKAERADDLTI